MAPVTITLDEKVAEQIAVAIRKIGWASQPGNPFQTLLAEIDKQSRPTIARVECPYCHLRQSWPTYPALRNHIVRQHNGITDDNAEDCAMNDAWLAFREAGLDPDKFA